jgi:hypothetical protein
MGSVDNGAQRASRQTVTATLAESRSKPSSLGRLRWTPVLVLVLLVLGGQYLGSAPRNATSATSDILMPRSELLALPTTGTAWTALKAVADASLPAPDLCNIDSDHHLRTLAAAVVYARTGITSYATKARAAILAALPTQVVGCSQAALALGRQLFAYVVSADLIGLSGTADSTFRSWLASIRTKNIGGHPVWNSLVGTHRLSPNNWGAYAGASRIAADLYLGDAADLDAAAKVTRGFLGDRTAYAGFTQNLSSAAISWTCTGSVLTYTPTDGACTRGGINLDGGVAADVSRGGSLRWPPADPGISYQLEAIQGLGLQVELLHRHGYSDAWSWSSSALRRMAGVVTRSAASGGTGWNGTHAARQMPWLLNLRYGTSIPTVSSGMGRAIGFTDWLYGSRSGSAAPAPTPKPTAAPTATPPPTSQPQPTPTPTPTQPASRSAPTMQSVTVVLGRTAVPTAGVPSLVRWSVGSTSDGVKRYDLQVRVDSGSYQTLALATPLTTARWVTLSAGHRYGFRVRAVDRSGRIGTWRTATTVRGVTVSDASTAIGYRGTWGSAGYALYLGRAAHYTRATGATATFRFSGTAFAIIGPMGPGRGRSTVYVDGRAVATIDQVASSFHARNVLLARNLAAGTHTITIRALGTSGRPMVAIDAIEILSPS